MYCKEIPYIEAKHEGREKMAYGQWLWAEAKDNSPYWKIFYGPSDKSEQTEEVVPETPLSQIPTIPLLPLRPFITAANRPSSVNRSTVPEEEPVQQLHQCPVVHQPSLHTALIPAGFALVANILR